MIFAFVLSLAVLIGGFALEGRFIQWSGVGDVDETTDNRDKSHV